METFTIYDERGGKLSQTNNALLNGKQSPGNFIIHRAELQSFLVSKVDPESVYFNKRMIDFEQTSKSVIVKFADSSVHETEYLVVADGIHSVARQKLLPHTEPRFAGQTCWRSVVALPELVLEESFETWGRKGRFGLGPLPDHKFYWYASLNARQNDPIYRSFGIHDLQKRFSNFHTPIPEVLAASTDADLIWSDIIDIKPISHYAFDRIVLIGDASHATTPNLGQGGAMAIEDALILAAELKKEPKVNLAFLNFERRRLPRTRKIINESWRVGKISQIENRVINSLRNWSMRHMPASVNKRRLEFLFNVDF
jgi:2-polyprenyl-6-methoxyphenol hydroxylase-like FAD-dependent oxidoreductase